MKKTMNDILARVVSSEDHSLIKNIELNKEEKQNTINIINEYKYDIQVHDSDSILRQQFKKDKLEILNKIIKKDNFKKLSIKECKMISESIYSFLVKNGYYKEDTDTAEELTKINILFKKFQDYAEYDLLKAIKTNKRFARFGIGTSGFEQSNSKFHKK